MDSRIVNKALNVLTTENYSYNIVSGEWKIDKTPVEECDVIEAVILWARKNTHIHEKGVFAEAVVKKAKQMPEFTHASFVTRCTARDRGKRIAGKHLFAAWCKTVDIEIKGTLEDFIRKNSLLVSKFYNYLANGMISVKKRARIFGELASSVFIGLALKEENDTQAVSNIETARGGMGCNHLRSASTNSTRVQRRRHTGPV